MQICSQISCRPLPRYHVDLFSYSMYICTQISYIPSLQTCAQISYISCRPVPRYHTYLADLYPDTINTWQTCTQISYIPGRPVPRYHTYLADLYPDTINTCTQKSYRPVSRCQLAEGMRPRFLALFLQQTSHQRLPPSQTVLINAFRPKIAAGPWTLPGRGGGRGERGVG